MANEDKNPPASPSSPSPVQPTATERTLDLYRRGEDHESGLKKEVKDADTARIVAAEKELAATSNQQFKWCLLQKSEAASKEYEGLQNGVTIVAKQDVLEIDSTIAQHVAQAGKVKAAFTELNKALQSIKTTLTDVESTSYQISELLENSSTTAAEEELKWLNNHVTDFLKRVREIGGDTGEKNPKQYRKPLTGLADETNDLADDASEVAVWVCGISESANVLSLTNLSKQLVTDITALHDNVVDNVKFAYDQKKDLKLGAQETLTQMLVLQRATRAEKFRKEHMHTALLKAIKFVRIPDCPADEELSVKTREKLEQIQDKVENSF